MDLELAKITASTLAVSWGTGILVVLFSIFIFNSNLKEKKGVIEDVPFWYAVLGAPVIEEILFRGFPSLIYGTSWSIGIPVSILFGLLHSASSKKYKIVLDLTDIHWIPATIAGFWLWYINYEYGFVYAVYAHVVNNFSTLCLAKGINYFERNRK